MKLGPRKLSLKKSLRAKTTGRVKRTAKKTIIPGYGRVGSGVKTPKKAAYNKVYNKTSYKAYGKGRSRGRSNAELSDSEGCIGCLTFIIIVVLLLIFF